MSFITWLVVGAAIGWLASRIMKTDGRQALIANVGVGIVGGLAGGWLLSPLMGVDTVRQHGFSGLTVLVSFSGAMILLLIVNVIRQIAADGD